jgi:RND superfamily putative drug exporter
VSELRLPYAAGNGGQISKDGHSVLIEFRFAAEPDPQGRPESIGRVVEAVKQVAHAHPGFYIGEYGDASANKAIDDSEGKDFHRAELLSIPLSAAILLVTFGAVVAAGIPVLLALTAVIAALGLIAFPSHIWPADDAASSVILLIGLAVGVDYSLFYIRREREERAAGRSAEAALAAAAATSGRAVLVSGMTVLIAMAGMFLTGSKIFTAIGVGTILVVAIAMVGSLTVLPALLSKLGDRIEKGRLPLLTKRRIGNSRILGALVDHALRRPVVSIVVTGGALLALAAPAFSLHTNNAGETALPQALEIAETYERMQRAFPGGAQPAYVVATADDIRAESVRRAVAELRRRALETGMMKNPIEARASDDRKVAVISVPLVGSGTDTRSERALALLRTQIVPETLGRVEGVEAAVTGVTASSKDFNDLLKQRIPIVFAFVLGLAFVLLLTTFRSIVVAVKAIVLNLLSVGAAYGVLVAVFQWGWGEALLDFKSSGGITSWLPLFLFVVLFGLSMDYHVFILTRVREAVDRGFETERALAHGLKTTAGVVTSAALVMVGVFAVFATLSQIELKQLGVGLATAILLDATLVRAVLLPATMKILGERNWYLPRWLEWLPRFSRGEEPGADAAGCAAAAARAR